MLMPLIAAIGLVAGTAHPAPANARTLPTTYEAGHYYATPETTAGEHLRLLVDTGGGGGSGLYWLSGAAVQRLHLTPTACAIGDAHLTVAPLPDYRPGHSLPPPLPGPCGDVVLVNERATGSDGQLGAGYLPGRVWTFDYPNQRLLLEGTAWHPDPSAHAIMLGFPRNAEGGLASGFPRIVIHVDGEPLDMLLDTGATAHPTAEGVAASGTPTVNGTGVTSYITTSMLEHWHRAHPDWRVVEQGDDLLAPRFMARLIEVPAVRIAGWSVGPVWFTERPDTNFHDVMSSYMDKRVEGAVGANVFNHFAMTIDYPRSTAYFRCVHGCKDVTPPPAP